MAAHDLLYEHLGYWRDDMKVQAYRDALEEVLTPGARVLDLGSGTGLLGLLAAEAGAAEVWSYDYGPILGAAREIAAANGLESRMHFIQEFTSHAALPEADVIICDQIGGFVFDAGVFGFFADAKERSLRPGGVLIPSQFQIFAVPVEAPGPYEEIDGWDDRHGFDLTSMRKIASNTEHRVGPHDISLLSEGVMIDDRASHDTSPIKSTCEWVASRTGVMHGLSGWFNAQLSPSVTLTNHPLDADRMKRWINFYPVEKPVAVEQGTPISASIDIRPEAKMVTWSVQVGDEPKQRMSTFNGQFIFEPGARVGESPDPDLTERRAALVIEITTASLAGTSTAQLIDTAQTQEGLFPTNVAAASFVRNVVGLLS